MGSALPSPDPNDLALSVRGLSGLVFELPAFDLYSGECVTLLGPSGSGKTLLLRALADLDPNSGTVRLNGRPRESMPAPQWRRAVTYVAAKPGWWTESVSGHFADWEPALDLAGRFGLSQDCAAWPVERLSSGEAQRLALIRALVQSPEVLLLDEPTAALDAETCEAVEAAIQERQKAGTSVLWVTHDRAQAQRVSSRSLRFAQGRIQESAP